MASKGKAVRMVVMYGPVVAEAARKYAPVVWDQLKNQREPVERLVQQKATRGNQRKKALSHAGTLVDGSVVQVFDGTEPHWVVFSGEQPIAVHPPTRTPYEQLLENVDLGTRVLPPRRPAPGMRRRRPARGAGPRRDAGTDVPRSRDEMPVIRPEEPPQRPTA